MRGWLSAKRFADRPLHPSAKTSGFKPSQAKPEEEKWRQNVWPEGRLRQGLRECSGCRSGALRRGGWVQGSKQASANEEVLRYGFRVSHSRNSWSFSTLLTLSFERYLFTVVKRNRQNEGENGEWASYTIQIERRYKFDNGQGGRRWRKYRRGQIVTLAIKLRQLHCRCPKIKPGASYLILDHHKQNREANLPQESFIIDRNTLVIQWKKEWKRRMKRFKKRSSMYCSKY